jgi:integrase
MPRVAYSKTEVRDTLIAYAICASENYYPGTEKTIEDLSIAAALFYNFVLGQIAPQSFIGSIMRSPACDRGRTPLLRPLIVLAIETSMRRSELLDLDWEYVDLRLCVAYLPLTKNGDSRDVPLSRRAVQTLQQLRADGPKDTRVFPLTGNAVRQAFEHLRVRAGMSDLHFHDLRHEAISRLFEKGSTSPKSPPFRAIGNLRCSTNIRI